MDLRSDIAAEARAKIVYERLINFTDDAELVDQYFDDSTGLGDRGETNSRGPWNEGGDWELVEAPAFSEIKSHQKGTHVPGNGAVLHTKRTVAGKAR